MKIVCGSSNKVLAENIAGILKTNLLNCDIKQFSDKEIFVELLESVRGEDVFIIQSLSTPANDHIMELLFIIDALNRASAKRITAIIPYFGYSRQDRMTSRRVSISAKVIANMISYNHVSSIVTLDLHSAQVQGFFDIPVINLSTQLIFANDIKQNLGLNDAMIISPDIGGVLRAQNIANKLSLPLSVIDKRREATGSSYINNIIGNVFKKDCIIIDDIVDSGGTLYNATNALIKYGASSVTAYATHGVLSSVIDNIEQSGMLNLIISDSIVSEKKISQCSKIRVVSVASLIASAITRINSEMSMADLFT